MKNNPKRAYRVSLWLFAIIVGVCAAHLLWLIFLQNRLPGSSGFGLGFVTAFFLSIYFYRLFTQWLIPRMAGFPSRQRVLFIVMSLLLGGWMGIQVSSSMPENHYLRPIHYLTITVEDAHNPNSRGNKVQLLRFSTSIQHHNLSEMTTNGGWVSTRYGLSVSEQKPASLQWQGRTGRQTRMIFSQGPDAGRVRVSWDGSESTLDLFSPQIGTRVLVQEFPPTLRERGFIPSSLVILFSVLFLIIITKYHHPLVTWWYSVLHTVLPHFRGRAVARPPSSRNAWMSLFTITIISSFLYVFMETIFIFTKPHFMTLLGMGLKIEVFLFTAAFLALLSALLVSIPLLLSRLPRFKVIEPSPFIALGSLLPAVMLAGMILLMADNFTYTLFGFGVVSSRSIFRFLYCLLFLFMTANSLKVLLGSLSRHDRERKYLLQQYFLVGLSCLLIASLVYPILSHQAYKDRYEPLSDSANRTPHIILITPDGLNSENMSVYGYGRNTTPNILKIAPDSLIAENAFSNAGNTTGSITSILTSKHPMNTRVLFAPNILRGLDAYQHLPALLRAQGYYNVQLSVPHSIDANSINLLNSFNHVNGRSYPKKGLYSTIAGILPHDFSYFIYEISNRFYERMVHIFFIQKMENPHYLVTNPSQSLSDSNKTRQALLFLSKARAPMFIHIHFMGTHGPTFVPQRQVFSNRKDIETQNEWDTDFYDDAVLEYDNYIGILVDELQNLGLLEDTILILASDHGMEWEYKTRIPLIIRFPNRLHAARIQTNVQNLDIAPTLLDYLGMQIPDWMEGRSLIREIPPIPIIGTKAFEIVRTGEDKWIMNQQALTAPFFQFNLVSAIYCQKWVELNLVDLTTRSGMIGGHTSPCHAGDMPPDEKYLSWIINHLVANGFDTSGLQIP